MVRQESAKLPIQVRFLLPIPYFQFDYQQQTSYNTTSKGEAMTVQRLIRDGQVAVLVSPKYGGGWYSWNHNEELLYDPSIAIWLENNEHDKIQAYLGLRYPTEYIGGLDGLVVEWIPVGTRFRIDEHDGAETLVLETNVKWLTA